MFSKAFVGAFFGRLAGALFVAACIYFGFGPSQWIVFIAGHWVWPAVARTVFILLGLITLVFLTFNWWSVRIASVRQKAQRNPKLLAPITILAISAVGLFVGAIWLIIEMRKPGDARIAVAPSPPTIQSPSPPIVPSPATTIKSIYNPNADEQRALLETIIPLIPDLPRRINILRPRDTGAQNVARTYEKVFNMAGFDAEQDQQAQTDANQTGQIMMGVSDSRNPPKGAIELAEAMRKIGFTMPFLSLPEKLQTNEFAIFVGMNPL